MIILETEHVNIEIKKLGIYLEICNFLQSLIQTKYCSFIDTLLPKSIIELVTVKKSDIFIDRHITSNQHLERIPLSTNFVIFISSTWG